jgi:UDP-2,4-diacetamido-2,4,6-trideoxy-beta-L-altropyranose hydrolase
MINIGIIFDSRKNIGSGHFWRCLNLAKILKKKERNFYFFSNFLNTQFINILKKENFNYFKIKNLNNFLTIKQMIKNYELDIFITDYYDLKGYQKKQIKKLVKCLIVIDDHINKKHYSDVYINFNFMSKKNSEQIKRLNSNSKLFLGIKYFILLNNIFKKNKIIKRKNKIKNVFVFFGSSDHSNETFKFLKSIHGFENINFKILIGKVNSNYKKIRNLCKKLNNVKLFYNLSNENTLKLMKDNDLSFGAGGVNLIERLFLFLPSIVICTANNQKDGIIALKNKNIIHSLGDYRLVNTKMIKDSIYNFVKNPKKKDDLLKKTNQYFGKKVSKNLLKKELNSYIEKKIKNYV